ncbi:hypothetical protein LIER_27751 [Lithospermum erythrorhizon]|uniref:GLTSCR protein conserved domain-containing protein n=1 Tax=Lithospermum erythrorhizon TaxID=34254 RepID=A0AAV3RDH4_LITER
MDEENAFAQQQRVMQQQQQRVMQEQQQLLWLQHLQRQKQQQDAISRFPSNMDVHLHPQQQFLHRPTNAQSLTPNPNNPNFNAGSSHPHLFQMPNPLLSPTQGHQYQVPKRNNNLVINDSTNNNSNSSSSNPQQQSARANPAELQMAYQDAWKVCHPDFKTPFTSLEDACERLLPYHVVADYEAEEDDKILDTDSEDQMSRTQQWDNNIAAKVEEFTTTFEKQVLAFNIISRKRALGEFRAEEKLMVEQLLLQEEKRAYLELRAEMESRQKMSQEITDANLCIAMAHGEQTHGGSQVRRDMVSPPFRGSLHGSQVNNIPISQETVGRGQEVNYEDMNNGLGNSSQIDDKEPSDNFLNDEETEDGDTGTQSEWQAGGVLDLNMR